MPKGSPNTQTRATDKYQRKAGYITKSFKLKKDITDKFIEACNVAGVSQASQITAMMKAFIEKQEIK